MAKVTIAQTLLVLDGELLYANKETSKKLVFMTLHSLLPHDVSTFLL